MKSHYYLAKIIHVGELEAENKLKEKNTRDSVARQKILQWQRNESNQKSLNNNDRIKTIIDPWGTSWEKCQNRKS